MLAAHCFSGPSRLPPRLLVAWLCIPLLVSAGEPTNASAAEAVTARIKLGPSDGAARPQQQGHAVTGGGNIDVSQPAPDTLVIRMAGNVGACGSLLCGAEGALEFCENLQFAVEFSEPCQTGQLLISASVYGVLAAKGKQSAVGMSDAHVALATGSQPITSLVIPSRVVGCGESLAISASQGPICIPVFAGCYQLSQSFRIFANQPKGCWCGRAIGEFSPTPLSSTWLGPSYPFQQVDKSGFGYQVTVRVVPEP